VETFLILYIDKNAMILISAIGFEEKFLVRCFLRRGKNQIHKVILVKPKDGDNRKTEEAISNLKKILDEASVPLEMLEVNPLDFVSAVVTIARKVKSIKRKDFLLNLSSGMRILNLEILSAFMMLGYDAEIEVELESLNGLVVWRLKDLIPTELDDKEKVILKAIRDGHYKVRDISSVTKIPLSTVSKKIAELESKGYLERSKEVKLTKKGEMIIELENN
jgi:CRISPR-associated protein Csa3